MLPTQLFADSNSYHSSYMPNKSSSTDRFATEDNLVTLFEKVVGRKLNKNKYGIMTELECGDGIADIVLYELRKDWERALPLGNIPPRWTYALRKLPYRKNFSTDEFLAKNLISRNTGLKILNLFTELNYCVKKGKHTWCKVKQPPPMINNILAVEAKLRHWQRALKQALRYCDYASQSWVLLDEYSIKPAVANKHEFERLNIGLATISTSGVITTYYEPRFRQPKHDSRFWQANSEIARRLMLPF